MFAGAVTHCVESYSTQKQSSIAARSARSCPRAFHPRHHERQAHALSSSTRPATRADRRLRLILAHHVPFQAPQAYGGAGRRRPGGTIWFNRWASHAARDCPFLAKNEPATPHGTYRKNNYSEILPKAQQTNAFSVCTDACVAHRHRVAGHGARSPLVTSRSQPTLRRSPSPSPGN